MNQTDSVKKIVKDLSSTERNRVLKKGETTTEIEVNKNNNQIIQDIVSAFGGIRKSNKSN